MLIAAPEDNGVHIGNCPEARGIQVSVSSERIGSGIISDSFRSTKFGARPGYYVYQNGSISHFNKPPFHFGHCHG